MSFLSFSANRRATVNYYYASSKNAEQKVCMTLCCVQSMCVSGRVSVGTEWLILVLPLSMSNWAWHRDKLHSSRDGKPLILHSSLALVKYMYWQTTQPFKQSFPYLRSSFCDTVKEALRSLFLSSFPAFLLPLTAAAIICHLYLTLLVLPLPLKQL